MHLAGCPQQNIEDSHEGELLSPYYPNYYLPNLNCTYHLIAPGRNLMVPFPINFSAAHIDYAIFFLVDFCNLEGTRVWIKFQVFQIGFHNGRQQLPCREEYVRVAWGTSDSVVLCGSYNLSRDTLQWISDGNRLSVQLMTLNGKQGRGFRASYRFGRCSWQSQPFFKRGLIKGTVGPTEIRLFSLFS